MQTIVVLCRPETSLNVGAICRVMANCNLNEMRIVGDRNVYNEIEVLTLALHARTIWDNAKFFPATLGGLKAATNDCNAIFATTRRTGIKRKNIGVSPNEFVQITHKENYEKIAIVFGNERTGLTDEEINICSHSINIPSSKNYPSYNLSHAVLIIAYTLFTYEKNLGKEINLPILPLLKWKEKTEILTFAQACDAASDIVYKLKQMGLYKKGGEKDCHIFLSQMISRSKLTKEESNFFINIFNKTFYETKK